MQVSNYTGKCIACTCIRCYLLPLSDYVSCHTGNISHAVLSVYISCIIETRVNLRNVYTCASIHFAMCSGGVGIGGSRMEGGGVQGVRTPPPLSTIVRSLVPFDHVMGRGLKISGFFRTMHLFFTMEPCILMNLNQPESI